MSGIDRDDDNGGLRSGSRRSFLKNAAAAAALAGIGASGLAFGKDKSKDRKGEKPGKGKTILVLGGTKFLGPAVVEAAMKRGHTVTLFNRGKTDPGRFPNLET